MVHSLMRLARNMGMRVIVEGVEKPGQLEVIRESSVATTVDPLFQLFLPSRRAREKRFILTRRSQFRTTG